MSEWIHPTAIVDEGAQLGQGTRVWHFTHVMAGAIVGRDCSLGQNVFVASGAQAVRFPVGLGITDGNVTEVTGLAEGREVITEVVRDKAHPAASSHGS